jgi:hypothetical protein
MQLIRCLRASISARLPRPSYPLTPSASAYVYLACNTQSLHRAYSRIPAIPRRKLPAVPNPEFSRNPFDSTFFWRICGVCANCKGRRDGSEPADSVLKGGLLGDWSEATGRAARTRLLIVCMQSILPKPQIPTPLRNPSLPVY